nr:hypothetical protein [Streptomyces violaceus]
MYQLYGAGVVRGPGRRDLVLVFLRSVSPREVSSYSTRGGTTGCTVRFTSPSRSSDRRVTVSRR